VQDAIMEGRGQLLSSNIQQWILKAENVKKNGILKT
jgi:hypothetical protein